MTVDLRTTSIVAAALLTCAGCAETPSRGASGASTGTTADAGTYTPGSIVLYVARQEIVGACGDDLSAAIQFGQDTTDVSPQQKVEIEKWALCLQRPALRHASVVLIPPAPSGGAAALFEKRAQLLRDTLAARGVEPMRVHIGAPPTSAAGSVASPPNALRVELIRADRGSP